MILKTQLIYTVVLKIELYYLYSLNILLIFIIKIFKSQIILLVDTNNSNDVFNYDSIFPQEYPV